MEQIGIRELRQHASRWLRRVAGGESFEVADRGRPVALLVPVPAAQGVDALIASGRATPGRGNLSDLGPPRALRPGALPPSVVLEQMRADER